MYHNGGRTGDESLRAAWQELAEQSKDKPWLLNERGATLARRYALWKGRLGRLRQGERRRLQRRLGVSPAGAALLLALAASPGMSAPDAPGAIITVDGATCTLADAITTANTGTDTGGCTGGTAGADTLNITANIGLTAALPAITTPITIKGNGNTISRSSGSFGILAVTSGGNLTLNSATVSGGSAYFGGGIYVFPNGVLRLRDSVLLQNTAWWENAFGSDSGMGGGMKNDGQAWIDSTAVVSSAPGVPNCFNAPLSLGNSLSSDGSCNLNAPGDMFNTAALLLPRNAGGPYYREPAPGSPAINHGNNAACPPHVQRGFPRPLGSVCDIGAIEVPIPAHQFIPLISRAIGDEVEK